MYKEKSVTDAQIDLSLYIEGLLSIDEAPVDPVTTADAVQLLDVHGPVQEEKIKPVAVETQDKEPDTGPIDCLGFSVDGTQFMLPAANVASIEKLEKKLTRIPLDSDAFQGVICHRGRSVAVINILALMQQGSAAIDHNAMQVSENFIKYVIIMEGPGYALACDEIGAIEPIHPGNIRWNKSSFNNRCYSGVVATRLCPLLNIGHIDELVMAMPFVHSLIVQPESSS